MNSKNLRFAFPTLVALFLLNSYAMAQQPAEPLTLRRAVSLAVQNSREVALARIKLTVSQNEAGVARSAFRPNLYAGSGAAYSKGLPGTPGGRAPSIFNLNYVQTLFNGPARGEVTAAERRTEIGRLSIDRARDATIVRAATIYLELGKVRRTVDLLRRERMSATKVLEITRQRVGEGVELPIEVTRAELSAARVEQGLVQLDGRTEVLENELRSLTGLGADAPIQLAPEDLPAEPPLSVEDLLRQAAENSIELKQAEMERALREEKVRAERKGYWPTVDLIGQYQLLSRINNYDEFFNKFERHNVTVGLSLQVPIYSASTHSAVALAQSELARAEMQLKQRRADLDLSVRSEARRVRSIEADREVARLELKLAQENLRVLQAGFDEGKINLREIEKARIEEGDRWRAFLDIEFERQKARLELLRITGQLTRVFP